MAKKNIQLKYAKNATYGNVAYDLNRLAAAERAAEPVREYEYQTEKPVKVQPVKAAAAVEETHQGISLFALAGFAVLAVLMVLILMANVQLTAINSEASGLRDQLTAAKEAESRLAIKYENTFDLASIEEYAVNVLGMQKVAEEQINVLESVKTDKAVVLAGDDKSNGGILRTALAGVLEYFR